MRPDELIQEAKDNVSYCWSVLDDFRSVAREDMEFINGNQWSEASASSRKDRPKEVVNDAIVKKRRVIKDYEQQKSSIKVTGVDNFGDKPLARTFQGIVDEVQRDSLGEFIMDDAFDDMLSCGMGYCYIDKEYESIYSNDQKITMYSIDDPFTVFFDPDIKKKDYTDAEWGGWLYTLTSKQYEEEYPDGDATGFPSGDAYSANSVKVGITLCRYYKVEYRNDTLVSVADPFSETPKVLNFCLLDLDKDKYDELVQYYKSLDPEFEIDEAYEWLRDNGKILTDRDIQKPQVKCYTMNNSEVLAEESWDGSFIPIIPMFGPKYFLQDSKYYWSLIRESKTPSRAYNYVISNALEQLAMNPVTPYIGIAGQFEGYENDWGGANNRPTPYLEYVPIELPDGTVHMVPPMKTQPAELPAGWLAMAANAKEDKQDTTGMYPTALGMNGSETSGKAVIERSDNSIGNVSVFFKQRQFSTILLGRMIVDLIPKVYDAPKVQRILGPDGKSDIVEINTENATQGAYKDSFLDIANSNFDVYVTTGPSADSQRKEAQSIMMEALKFTDPEFRPAVLPHVYRNLDIPQADQIADDIKKLGPAVLNEEEGQKSEEELQNENAQLQQQVEQLTQVNEEMEKVLLADQQKLQSNEKNVQLKAQTDLRREELKQQGETQREGMSNRTDIKEAEIDAQAEINVKMLDMMREIQTTIKSISQPQ